ncbi:MAG: hypothetical protein EHM72_16040 [Calditrichaeota bacterium]|nr:MAG: hypothetical protein EHM72_16040 [Calditrichota bacterium]
MNSQKSSFRFLTICLLLLGISPFFMFCEIDHGLGVSKSRIRGHLILPDMSLRPEYFEAVRVVALTKTLDAEDISLSDAVFSNSSIDLSTPRPAFDLPAPISQYEFIGAVWKKKDHAWDYTRIFGFYGFDPDSFKFEHRRIVLTEDEPIVDDIEIVCDWILVTP